MADEDTALADLIGGYMDGTLSAEESRDLEAHLHGGLIALDRFRGLLRLHGMLHARYGRVSLRERVVEDVKAEQRRQTRTQVLTVEKKDQILQASRAQAEAAQRRRAPRRRSRLFPPPRKKRTRATRGFGLALAASVAVLAGAGYLYWSGRREAAPREPVAMIFALPQNTRVVRAGRETAAAAGLPLFAGDVLRVGRDGSATVRYADASTLRLRAETDVTVGIDVADVSRVLGWEGAPAGHAARPGLIGKHVFLGRGALTAYIAEQPPGRPAVVVTPNALARVVGTRFELDVEPRWTRLRVKEGRVELMHRPDARSVVVPAGRRAVAAPGIPLEAQPIEARRYRANVFGRRFVLVHADMDDRKELARLTAIMQRAAAVGYNGVVLDGTRGDYVNLQKRARSYFANFHRLKRKADELGLALMPQYMSAVQAAYGNPTLVEAIPVRETPFVLARGVATVPAAAAPRLRNPGFEERADGTPARWTLEGPAPAIALDSAQPHGGTVSLCLGAPETGRRRQKPLAEPVAVVQVVALEPFRAYELAGWARTRGLGAGAPVGVFIEGANGRRLAWRAEDFFASSPDWRAFSVRFNSVDNTNAVIRIGARRDGMRGRLWLDDLTLREVGLQGLVRRDSLPVVVQAADGSVTYREGADYVIEKEELRVARGSRIPDAARLKVSWYQRADMLGGTAPASACRADYFEIHRRNVLGLRQMFGGLPGFVLKYDGGWTVANWDPAAGVRTAGEYVAETLRRSQALVRDVQPDCAVYLWNDMVDPYADAGESYWLVNGSLDGAWEGVAPETVILNRNPHSRRRVDSLTFFARRGHRQFVAVAPNPESVHEWLDAVDAVEAADIRGIVGFMYGSHSDTLSGPAAYRHLEAAANLCRLRDRWGGAGALSAQR
ncbi:MAG: FecR domain-containing protein [Kiritimatiellae bacterium]|nr:FecR domain-containing protein [Kiritimatiellia bacterium]